MHDRWRELKGRDYGAKILRSSDRVSGREARLVIRGISKSMPACNCHNKDDIVVRASITGRKCVVTFDYKYGSFREARCNCRLSHITPMWRASRIRVPGVSRREAWSPRVAMFLLIVMIDLFVKTADYPLKICYIVRYRLPMCFLNKFCSHQLLILLKNVKR